MPGVDQAGKRQESEFYYQTKLYAGSCSMRRGESPDGPG